MRIEWIILIFTVLVCVFFTGLRVGTVIQERADAIAMQDAKKIGILENYLTAAGQKNEIPSQVNESP